MPNAVSQAEMDVPARVPRTGSIDGTPKLTLGPTSLTGTVQAGSVPSRRAVGVPRLLTAFTARPAAVASRAAVGRPALVSVAPPPAPGIVQARPAGVASRARVGGPIVTSVTPPPPQPVPWWVRLLEWLRGRR